MSDYLIIEKDNVQVVEVNNGEILIVEKSISNLNSSGSWGSISGNIDSQLDLKAQLESKVDKEDGKTLSSNDYSNEDKEKLETIVVNGIGDKYLADDGLYKSMSSGISSFLDLSDTPENYIEQAKKVVAVNEEETNLEFVDLYTSDLVNDSNFISDSNYVHTDNNYTTEEKQNLANQRGTNTGDETQESINNKIGYTPANDLDVVKLTGNQTIAGEKTFDNNTSNVIIGLKSTSGISKIKQNGSDFYFFKNDTVGTLFSIRAGGEFSRYLELRSNGLGIFGGATITPSSRLHQDTGNGQATYHKFTAGTTTGTTSTDGFDIGITSGGVAQIKQLENLNLEFFTNNTKVGNISETGVWANNSGTWSTLSDERLKENIGEVNNGLDKVIALSRCVRHYTFKNQVKYATGYRTGYIAQLLCDNGFEGHTTLNNPVDEEEGVLLGWEYGNESYFEDDETKIRRIVVKEGDKILGIENNFTPYLIVGIKELADKVNSLEERIKNLENK